MVILNMETDKEKFASEKAIGYVLLVIGLIAIFYSAFSVYAVFTGLMHPFNLFKFDAIKLDLGKFIIQAPSEQKLTQEIVPADVLNSPMNYFAHLLLMGFLASVGLKIASIGTMLLRPIKIKIREDKKSVLDPN
jgi:hypothetical protein